MEGHGNRGIFHGNFMAYRIFDGNIMFFMDFSPDWEFYMGFSMIFRTCCDVVKWEYHALSFFLGMIRRTEHWDYL